MSREQAIDRLAVWAVRYALGRMTYAVHDVVETLIAHAEDLSPPTKAVIVRDINEAKAQREGGFIGMDFDDAAWMRLRAVLAPEPSGRPNRYELALALHQARSHTGTDRQHEQVPHPHPLDPAYADAVLESWATTVWPTPADGSSGGTELSGAPEPEATSAPAPAKP